MRIDRTDIIDGPIIDVDGGVWYSTDSISDSTPHNVTIAESKNNYHRLNLPPITRASRGLSTPVFLKTNGSLISASSSFILSEQLKKLEVADMIVGVVSLLWTYSSYGIVLTKNGILHWCTITESRMYIDHTIATNVKCMDIIVGYYRGRYPTERTIVVCLTDDRLQLICSGSSLIPMREFDLRLEIPEGVRSIERKIITTNLGRILEISHDDIREDATPCSIMNSIVLKELAVIDDLVDAINGYNTWCVIAGNSYIVYSNRKKSENKSDNESNKETQNIHSIHFNCKILGFINSRTQLSDNYVEDEDSNIYRIQVDRLKKIELPMKTSFRTIVRRGSTKPSKFCRS